MSVSPGTFVETTTAGGEEIVQLSPPSAPKLVALGLVVGFGFGLAFFLLTHRKTRFPVIASLILIGAAQAGVYVAFSFWGYHEEPVFCARTCHVMEPTYATFEAPGGNEMMLAHAANESVRCLDCHSGPGAAGQVGAMLTSARHIYAYVVSRDYDPEDLGEANATRFVPDENCLKCHSEESAEPLPEDHEAFQDRCALCHNPHAKEGPGHAVPIELFGVEACADCHEDAAERLRAPPGAHARVEAGDCRGCHVRHANATVDPRSIEACDAAGCHDADVANNLSLAARKHPRFDDRELACGDCHGKAHELRGPTIAQLNGTCKECHADAIRPLHDDPSPHTALVLDRGCEACHGEHEKPSPTACTDAGCHDQDPKNPASLAGLLHEGVRTAGRACADCHGKAHDLQRPLDVVLRSACDECHAANASQMRRSLTLHGDLANDAGCEACHTSHDPPTPPSCGSASCHVTLALPAPSTNESHASFAEERCADCHGTAHRLRQPPLDALREDCEGCHKRETWSLGQLPRHLLLAEEEGCDACHTEHGKAGIKACTDAGCHAAAVAAEDPHPPPEGKACADCHGTPHAANVPDLADLATACATCHSKEAAGLAADAPAHDLLAKRDGCDSCHAKHDPQAEGGVRACTDAACHDAATGERPPPHTPDVGACDACHGAGHALRTPTWTDLQMECADCHGGRAQPPPAQRNAHTPIIETKGCATCHTTHEPGPPRTCTDAGCHDASNAPDRHVPLANATCTTCHDGVHNVTLPSTSDIAPYCAECHAARAKPLLAAQTGHGALAREKACADCHTSHDAQPKACTDAGCHDDKPWNPLSLAAREHAPTPGNRSCADCHDAAHELRTPFFSEIQPYCADCHRANARIVEESTGGHRRIVETEGCDTCHVAHRKPAVIACTTSGCHDTNETNPARMPTNHTVARPCLDCHGDEHAPRLPMMSEMNASCASCHAESARRIFDTPSDHRTLAAKGCDTCHRQHKPDRPPACTGALCHDDNPRNPASLSALGHRPFPTETACATCHGGGHAVGVPSAADLESGCERCHAPATFPDGQPHANAIAQGGRACATCHAGQGAVVLKGEHATALCTNCHTATAANGPDFEPAATDVSAVAWNRQNNARFAYWTEGRGNHSEGADCTECHRFHESPLPVYPETCSPACHTWLGEVSQAGFPSAYGPTTYTGSTNPQHLLDYRKDLDGDGYDHNRIYKDFGCNGFCHNPAMTLEKAEAWGCPMGGDCSPGVDPDIEPSTQHGYIGPNSSKSATEYRASGRSVDTCTGCHRVVSPGNSTEDLHGTHIAFVEAERGGADTRSGAPTAACTYCHRTYPGDSAVQPGGCYNCHLSGHRPETYYWFGLPIG